MYIIPDIYSKHLTEETTFTYYLLFADTYSKITNFYGMESFITEEVMDKLDMFQSIFWKVDEFGWWDKEIIQTDAGTKFTYRCFRKFFLYLEYN